MTSTLAPLLRDQHLLFLNWRDRGHPLAGGAELYCESIAEALIARGARVTLFTAQYDGAPTTETVNGLRILRGGGTYGVYLAAARHLRRNRSRYDAVVDFQNGIPFFAPAFAGRDLPVVMVVHHVHQEQFRTYFRQPMSTVGRMLEGPASRAVYRHRPIVAVSPSTRRDVRRQLKFDNPIFVVPNGVAALTARGERSASPRIAVVTRLVPHKRLDMLLQTLPRLRARWPQLHVDIGGRGPAQDELTRLVTRLGIDDMVTFHGFVTDEERERMLTRAWITALPSMAEGWGLTVLEAASVGTPAVAFRVPGLEDSILDGRTGWLAEPGTDLVDAVSAALSAMHDPDTAADIGRACRSWADSFRWDLSAERLARIVASEQARSAAGKAMGRSTIDLVIEGRFQAPAGDADPLEDRLRGRLRATDELHRAGTSFTLVLHGADEVGMTELLRSQGFTGEVAFRLAGSAELLVSPEIPER